MPSTSAQLNQEPSHSCALNPCRNSHTTTKKVDTSLSVLMLEVATQQPPRVQLVGIGTVKEIVRHRKNLSTLEEDHSLKPLILSSLEVSHSWGTLS